MFEDGQHQGVRRAAREIYCDKVNVEPTRLTRRISGLSSRGTQLITIDRFVFLPENVTRANHLIIAAESTSATGTGQYRTLG